MFAQIFGGNPASVKWNRIKTSTANIIFPSSRDSSAQRIANIISIIDTLDHVSLKNKKVSIVIQNQNTIANGYVGLGPFRSEFYLTPDQNSFELGSLPSVDQLTVHEYSHIQQYNNFNVGLSKVFGKVFGQEGQALANNTAIPNWYFEGDAVLNESKLTEQGRGRLPSFFNGFSALWNRGIDYNWMKMRNGSYKDFVPDHYPLGYMLVAFGTFKYGEDFWPKVTHDAAAFKPLFYPFQQAFKKYATQNFRSFRKEALEHFNLQFKTGSKYREKSNQPYFDEKYPYFINNDTLIFVKKGYKQIPQILLKTHDDEARVRTQDYTLDNYFSYKNGKIVYSSVKPDIRWGYRIFNDIRIIDINSGKERIVTNRTRYFSPDISEDGKTIVAVNTLANGSCKLEILSAANGKVINSLPNTSGLFYTYPKFYDQKIISTVRNDRGEMSLALIDPVEKSTKMLLPFTFNVAGFPVVLNDTVYFSYSFFNSDELFAYTFSDRKLWQLLPEKSAGIGRYFPSVTRDKIVWSSFTSNGYRLQSAMKTDVKFKEIDTSLLKVSATRNFGISFLHNQLNILDLPGKKEFPASTYHKSAGLFNFHSIEPAMNDPEYSLTLVSENILNTLQSSVSLGYNRAEKSQKLNFEGTYAALFPYLTAGINYIVDRRTIYHRKTINYNSIQPYAGFSIPLNLSKNRSFRYLNFGSQYVFNQNTFTGLYKDSLKSFSYSYLNNFLSFSNQVQRARQQIYPRFAQAISFAYKTALSSVSGEQFSLQGKFFLPGLLRTHSLVLSGAFLTKDSLRQINFSSSFPFSRGYQAVNLFRMQQFSAGYNFPLFYPDAGFANILYFLRIRADIFYDQTNAEDAKIFPAGVTQKFRSAGTEISFDTKWWNQGEVSFGFRYSYLFDPDVFGGKGKNRVEIILPVNIFK